MRDEKRAARKREIEEAAFDVLIEKGYAAASMLSVAKRAGASNETLYRWYGDKTGLYRALVERNAERVVQPIQAAIAKGAAPAEVLEEIGPVLLAVLVSDRAAALNRAAAAEADDKGVLGEALADAGRETVRPLLIQALAPLGSDQAQDALDLYLSLLVGDWQLRRVTGAMRRPTQAEIEERASRALRRTRDVFNL